MDWKLIGFIFTFGFFHLGHAQMELADQNSYAFKKYADEFATLVNHVQLEKDVSYLVSTVPVADSCITMISSSYILGKVGESIFNELTRNASAYPELINGGSINATCRKYKTMNNNQRALVWVMIMTTMAHFESSCSQRSAKGPNGIAAGYFQLHKGKENLYVKDTPSCVKNASSNPIKSSQCVLGMLERQMQRSGVLFDNKSYWEVLRPKGPAKKAEHIAKALGRSTLCNPVML